MTSSLYSLTTEVVEFWLYPFEVRNLSSFRVAFQHLRAEEGRDTAGII
jgi:hypothetical protein